MSEKARCLKCVTKQNVSNVHYERVGMTQPLTVSKIRMLPVRKM